MPQGLDPFVVNGVVGTRDTGSSAEFILPLRDRIKRGETAGPEIVAAGPILDSLLEANSPPAETLPETVRSLLVSGIVLLVDIGRRCQNISHKPTASVSESPLVVMPNENGLFAAAGVATMSASEFKLGD